MAGSFSSIVDDDGRFTMDLIENLGDAHEALEECFDIIHGLVGGDLAKVPTRGAEGSPMFTGWHADQCAACRGSGSVPGSEAYNCGDCFGSGNYTTLDPGPELKQAVVGARHNRTDRALDLARSGAVQYVGPLTPRPPRETPGPLSEHFEKVFWTRHTEAGLSSSLPPEVETLYQAIHDTLAEAERRVGL